MKNLTTYLKITGYFVISIIILSLVLSFLNYFTTISTSIINTMSTIGLIIICFILAFKQGKITNSKGWFCGIKVGALFSLVLLLISLIFFVTNIKLSTILYYGILILSSIFGSIIGINKKKAS